MRGFPLRRRAVPSGKRPCKIVGNRPRGVDKKFTSVAHFPRAQLDLLQALLKTEPAVWQHVWMAGTLRRNMVVSDRTTGEVFYVLAAHAFAVTLLKLESAPGIFKMVPNASHICHQEPVISIEQYWAHDYELALDVRSEGNTVNVALLQTFSVGEYCGRRWLHLLPVKTLKKMLLQLGIELKGMRNQMHFATALLDFYEIRGQDRETMLEKLAAMAKRRANSIKPQSVGATSDDGNEEESGDEPEEDIEVPTVLTTLAPNEVEFVCRGGPASAALMEEEDDEGLDAAAGKQADPAPSPLAAPVPRAPSSSSSSGATPGGPPAVPPPQADSPALDHDQIRAVAHNKQPASEVLAAPPGCSLRAYEPEGRNPYWVAKLPAGKRFQSPSSTMARNSRSRDWGAHLRSKEKARLECLEWLRKAESSGVLA